MSEDLSIKPEQQKPANYIFDIEPGLEVKKASITHEQIIPDQSVFTSGQLAIIDRIINAETDRFLEEKASLEATFLSLLEKEKALAWQSGNEAGIASIEATKAEMIRQTEDIIVQLRQLMDRILVHTDTFIDLHEQEILKLIINIARKVIDYEVSLNPKIILRLVKNSLELINEKEEVKVLVNPEDLINVRENLGRLNLSIDMPKNIDVVSSESVERGGCRIDFKFGSIDADIDTQFSEIKRKLLKMV